MAYKNLGPNVSQNPQAITAGGGQYTAEDHSFESIVMEQNKPVTDWEMNLMQEVLGSSGLRGFAQNFLPSCWLNNTFLERTKSYVPLAPDPGVGNNANQFYLQSSNLIVNGWQVRFDLTESAISGDNLIRLPVPPVAGKRTDLVILEVWRALISPAPSVVNKSVSGQILRFGNAKAPDGPPVGNQNLADDLIDPVFLSETSRRVQIQYRYRVITGVNIITYPDGLDDPTVVANTAPYFLASPVDGAATAFAYTKHPADQGLWVAGTNDAAGVAALGTVDGLMYAIPICAVFRRNSTAFTRSVNPNGGGTMLSGVSGRPDGYYCDQINLNDILDLRKGVAWDLTEILDKSLQDVLEGSLRTAVESTATVAGNTLSISDSLGLSAHIGNPDSIRKDFSDRSVTESVVAKVVLGAPSATVVFNLNAFLPAYGAGAINVLAIAPTNTCIAGIGRARLVKPASDTDLLDNASAIFISNALLDVNVGPGVDRCTLTLNAAAAAGDIVYLELLVEYPINSGISRNIRGADGFWTPPAANIAAWMDGAVLTATSDANRKSLNSTYWWIDVGHRELSVRLPTTAQTDTIRNPEASALYIPDYVTGLVTINDGTNPVYTTSNYSYNTGYTRVVLNFALALQTAVTVTWTALRPIPPVGVAPGDSYQLFFTSAAIQSVPVPAGIQTLSLTPRAISRNMHVITSGTGSPDDSYPFTNPGEMVPIGLLPAASFAESSLNTPNAIAVTGFSTDTGYVTLPTLVPYSPNPGQVTLFKSAPDVTVDADLRNFWPKSSFAPTYSPTAYAQTFTYSQKRKTVLPMIAELKQNVPSIGRKGTYVLVVFTDWSDFTDANSVGLKSTLGSSCASVYRIPGSIMNPRRVFF